MFNADGGPVRNFCKYMVFEKIKKLLWTPKQGCDKKVDLAARLLVFVVAQLASYSLLKYVLCQNWKHIGP